jgi:hypothetical protein
VIDEGVKRRKDFDCKANSTAAEILKVWFLRKRRVNGIISEDKSYNEDN